jgi:FkbM family methyltransferase
MNSNEKMIDGPSNPTLPPFPRVIRFYLRSGLRGATRLTYLMARHVGSLQHIPLQIPGWSPVHIDLRLADSHNILMNSPYNGPWRELDEISIMQRFVRKGDVAFDIGANIGLHSILLSSLVGSQGRLCVFEPNAELLPALRHTVGQLANATLYPLALSNKDRSSTLFVPSDHSTASLADWTVSSPVFRDDGPSHLVTCNERQTDNLIEDQTLPVPDFIKCDVEGAELLVFQGARKTLDRVEAPIILFEANECASRAFNLGVSAAKDFLAGLDVPRYHFFEIKKEGKLERLQGINSSFLNMLAIPASKIFNWPELASL